MAFKARRIDKLLKGYDLANLSLGSVGSHSMLDVAVGAKAEGFKNFTIAKKGRERPYTRLFKERKQGRRTVGCIQDVYVVDDWMDAASPEVVSKVRDKNGVGIINRAFTVYLRDKSENPNPDTAYDLIKGIGFPFLGNIDIAQAEERDPRFRIKYNQDFLLEKAGIPVPRRIDSPKEIREPVMIKAAMYGSDRDFARDFPVVSNYKEYKAAVKKAVARAPDNKKKMVEEAFLGARIEEYIPEKVGPINLNFFYSPTWDDLELLGTDTRTQFLNGEERTHYAISLRESLYEQVDEVGRALLDTVNRYYRGGIGLCFAIQCMGHQTKEILLAIDTCYSRPAGSPDILYTPPSDATHGKPVSYGRRIAMEFKDAWEQGGRKGIRKILS